MSLTPTYQLHRNAFGRLVFTSADGETSEGVMPVRAFPIAAPDDGIALVDPHGHELAWIDRLEDLPEAMRALVAALKTRRLTGFCPGLNFLSVAGCHMPPLTIAP